MEKTSKSTVALSIFIMSLVVFSLGVYFQALIICILLLYFLSNKRYLSRKFASILLLIFLLGGCHFYWHLPKKDTMTSFINKRVLLEGVVSTTSKKIGNKIKFNLNVSKVQSDDVTKIGDLGKSAVSIYGGESPEIGDKISLFAKVYSPHSAKNLGQFDYAKYLENKGIFTTVYAGHFKTIGVENSAYYQLMRKFNQYRKSIMLAHNDNLSSVHSKLLGGVIFGYRAVDIPENVKQDFINSGLLHLLSASGLHVGLILGIWYFIAKALRFPPYLRIISSGIVVFLYSCLTGFPPSILRAMLMAEFILLGNLIDRKADNIALLLLVGVLMLGFNPMYINDIGFQLSFVVTFGILFCLPLVIDKIKNIPELISGSVFVPIIAQFWAMPLLVYHFNTLPLYSILANIIIIPFMAIISFLGFLSSVFVLISSAFPFLGSISVFLDKILQPFLYVMMFISGHFSGLPNSILYMLTPKILSVFLLYALAIILILAFKKDSCLKKISLVGGFGLILLLLMNLSFDFSNKISTTFFSVGNADSMLVELPNKKKILIDAGRLGFGKYNSGYSVIVPYFKHKGIYNLDSMILTHPDSDHIGGALNVMKYAKVGNIYAINKKCTTQVCQNLSKYIFENKLSLNFPKTQDELNLDKDVSLKFIVPEGSDDSTFNDDSIITYLRYKDFSALFMGDNESQVLSLLKKHISEPVDVLKVGHHGSKKSISAEMLEFLKPKIALISVGKNGFGHPSEFILNLLDKHNVKVIRTDKENMVQIDSDGSKIDIKGFLSENMRMEQL